MDGRLRYLTSVWAGEDGVLILIVISVAKIACFQF
jgi:hypothetical protein